MLKTKEFIWGLITLGVIGVCIFYWFLQNPHRGTKNFINFSIESGESFKTVAGLLKDQELIRSESFFYYLGRITDKSGSLKAGEYELSTQMTAWEILKVITGSHVKLYRVTIPEGLNLFQIAALLDDLGLVDQIQFLETCWDAHFLQELRIPSFTVEGYIYPETYYIPRGTSARSMIRMFVEMFWSRLSDTDFEKASSGPLSIHEAIILASVIQKETSLVGEMPIISGVFANRMAKHMKLQSDPTAIYDISPYGGRVTREMLLRKSLYNTYSIEGVPLAPISNPGSLAIHAALFPQSHHFLYFVSRRDGSHQFSESFEEHREAIQKYLQ